MHSLLSKFWFSQEITLKCSYREERNSLIFSIEPKKVSS